MHAALVQACDLGTCHPQQQFLNTLVTQVIEHALSEVTEHAPS